MMLSCWGVAGIAFRKFILIICVIVLYKLCCNEGRQASSSFCFVDLSIMMIATHTSCFLCSCCCAKFTFDGRGPVQNGKQGTAQKPNINRMVIQHLSNMKRSCHDPIIIWMVDMTRWFVGISIQWFVGMSIQWLTKCCVVYPM